MKLLERITTRGKVIKYIDGLRGLSVIIVFLCHFLANHESNFTDFQEKHQWLYPFFGNGLGHHGVYLFFAISGFILSFPFINQIVYQNTKVNLKAFYTRRVSRIEPPYIIALISFFILALLFGEKTFTYLFPHLVASLLYLHNIIFGGYPEINVVLWSLEIEVQFYLLAPVLSLLIFKLPKWTRRVMMLITIILWQYILEPYDIRTLYNYFHFFMVGILSADLYLEYHNKIKQSFLYDVICIPSLVIFWQGTLWSHFHWLYILFFLTLTPHSFIWKYIMERKFIVVIGGMCYSIYMLHHKIIYVFWGVFKPKHLFFDNDILNFSLRLLLISTITAICSIIFFIFIERPTMKREWWKYKSLKNLFFK